MSAPTIAETLKFACLQMAAEALYGLVAVSTEPNQPPPALRPGQPIDGQIDPAWLTTGNLHASKFAATEATRFAGLWEVVEHISNTTTGFSGTLFKAKETRPDLGIVKDELVLCFRSTEFIDDHARDNTATNVLEIKEKGFAFGQLSDMEAWYADLGKPGGPLAGKTVSVTGYSLGAHLATAFSLMHPGVATQVINFNGAGLGKIDTADGTLAGTQAKLREMIDAFRALRIEGETTGLIRRFRTAEGTEAYLDLRARLAANNGIPGNAVSGQFDTALFGIAGRVQPTDPEDANRDDRQADYDLLHEALSRMQSVFDAAHAAPLLNSGSNEGPPNPANIRDTYTRLDGSQAPAIADELLDYQLAVVLTAKRFQTESLSDANGVKAARGEPTRGNGWPLQNQWDVIATETTSDPWYMVAYSQFRYGNDLKLYIEDQPFARGTSVPRVVVKTAMAGLSPQLLVSGYANNDFGDTHSLVLIVDSLSVMSLMARIDPAFTPELAANIFDATTASKAITQSVRQGKAEGDTLETVVNALGRLLLGPPYTPLGLTGLNEGNTWWNPEQREKLAQAIQSINTELDAGPQPQRSIVSLASLSTADLQSAASNPDALATRYALKELNPFAVFGADYSAHQTSRALYDPTVSVTSHESARDHQHFADGQIDMLRRGGDDHFILPQLVGVSPTDAHGLEAGLTHTQGDGAKWLLGGTTVDWTSRRWRDGKSGQLLGNCTAWRTVA